MDDLSSSALRRETSPQRVLILAGAGRSGSTLLERVVGRLPGVTPLGEVRYWWDRGVLEDQRCGCGRAFADCPFWTEVGRRAFGSWSSDLAVWMAAWREHNDRAKRIPALLRAHREPRSLDGATDYAGAFARTYLGAAEVAGSQWVVDSSKHVSMAYVVSLSKRLEIRVLQVVRDPRGVAYSWRKKVVRPEISERVELMPRYSSFEVASTWLIHNLGLAALTRIGVPVLRIRYEDFIDQPLATLRRIARFVDREVPPMLAAELGDRQVKLPPSHTVAGNPMRFRVGDIRLKRDDAWGLSLPRRDQRMIAALTAPLLVRYGYPLSVPAGWSA